MGAELTRCSRLSNRMIRPTRGTRLADTTVPRHLPASRRRVPLSVSRLVPAPNDGASPHRCRRRFPLRPASTPRPTLQLELCGRLVSLSRPLLRQTTSLLARSRRRDLMTLNEMIPSPSILLAETRMHHRTRGHRRERAARRLEREGCPLSRWRSTSTSWEHCRTSFETRYRPSRRSHGCTRDSCPSPPPTTPELSR